MIEVHISDPTQQDIKRIASKEAEDIGNLRGSIENGGGNFAGIAGELVFVRTFGGLRKNTFDYDIIYKDAKIDVKTKRRTVPMKPGYEVSVAAYNTEQACDIYYFVSILEDFTKAWLCGYRSKPEYYEDAVFLEEGDYFPDNGFRVHADCYNMEARDLYTSEKGEQMNSTVTI